jgi:large subunit ribosomal protein L15
VLASHGLIGSGEAELKMLGTGEIGRAVTVKAHAFSATAREKIEAAGGTASVIGSDTEA